MSLGIGFYWLHELVNDYSTIRYHSIQKQGEEVEKMQIQQKIQQKKQKQKPTTTKFDAFIIL